MKSVFNEQIAIIFWVVKSFFVLILRDLTFCIEKEKLNMFPTEMRRASGPDGTVPGSGAPLISSPPSKI